MLQFTPEIVLDWNVWQNIVRGHRFLWNVWSSLRPDAAEQGDGARLNELNTKTPRL